MSKEPDNLQKQLRQFGLSADQVTVFLEILSKNRISALQLSRNLKISRTKIYRILEKLIDKGLIIEEVRGYGKKFVAETPTKLLEIVNDKERELLLLKASAPTIVNQLNALKPQLDSGSKILHYRGIEGLKQVTWNSTKAKGLFRIYECGYSMDSFLEHDYAEKVRLQYAKSAESRFRQITNYTEFEPFTNVKDHIAQWEVRHIPKSKLNIQVEVQIYNDVYCLYEYNKEDIFIVEIYDQQNADMQKQIYDLIWQSAKKMKKLDNHGAVKLLEE